MDHQTVLPPSFVSVQAVELGRSPARHAAAALANLVQLVYPEKAHLAQALVSQIYQEYTEGPDIAKNDIGLTKEQAFTYLTSASIAFIDEQALLADVASLKHEMQAQNLSGVVQWLVLADESKLKHAITGQPLHNWATSDAPVITACSIIRVGYSDTVPYAFYLDASLHSIFSQPVPIAWSDIEAAGIVSCVAVLPHGVEAPPADFRYFAGLDSEGNMLPPAVWPIPVTPKPEVDVEAATRAIDTLMSHEQESFQARLAILGQLKTMLQGKPAS